jgi:hypothetical protein
VVLLRSWQLAKANGALLSLMAVVRVQIIVGFVVEQVVAAIALALVEVFTITVSISTAGSCNFLAAGSVVVVDLFISLD